MSAERKEELFAEQLRRQYEARLASLHRELAQLALAFSNDQALRQLEEPLLSEFREQRVQEIVHQLAAQERQYFVEEVAAETASLRAELALREERLGRQEREMAQLRERLEDDNELAVQRLEQCQRYVMLARQREKAFGQEKEQLRQSANGLQQQVGGLQLEREQLRRQVIAGQQEKQQLRLQARVLEEECLRAKGRAADCLTGQERERQLEEQLRQAKQHCKSVEARASQLQQEVAALRSQSEQWAAEEDNYSQLVARLRRDMVTVKDEWQLRCEELQASFAEQGQCHRCVIMAREVSEGNERARLLRQELDQAVRGGREAARLSEIQEERARLMEEDARRRLQHELSRARQHQQQAREAKTELEEKLKTIVASKQGLAAELESLKAQDSLRCSQIMALRQRAAQSQSLAQQQLQLKGEVAALKAKLQQVQHSESEARSTARASQHECATLREAKLVLERGIERGRDQRSRLEERLQEQVQVQERLRSELQKRAQKMQYLGTVLEGVSAARDQAQHQVLALRSQASAGQELKSKCQQLQQVASRERKARRQLVQIVRTGLKRVRVQADEISRESADRSVALGHLLAAAKLHSVGLFDSLGAALQSLLAKTEDGRRAELKEKRLAEQVQHLNIALETVRAKQEQTEQRSRRRANQLEGLKQQAHDQLRRILGDALREDIRTLQGLKSGVDQQWVGLVAERMEQQERLVRGLREALREVVQEREELLGVAKACRDQLEGLAGECQSLSAESKLKDECFRSMCERVQSLQRQTVAKEKQLRSLKRERVGKQNWSRENSEDSLSEKERQLGQLKGLIQQTYKQVERLNGHQPPSRQRRS